MANNELFTPITVGYAFGLLFALYMYWGVLLWNDSSRLKVVVEEKEEKVVGAKEDKGAGIIQV